jgi:Putative bacterial sensory transduction regulator
VSARGDSRVWELDGRLLTLLSELAVPFERVEAGAYVVELHGVRRSRTLLWLIAGEQAVAVEAFVMHVIAVPDPGPLHRHLLRRNLGLRTVHYATDDVGDLFLVGSLPHEVLLDGAHPAPGGGGLDGVLGEVLSLLEDDGPRLQALAYGDRLGRDEALAAKVRADGAGRRPAGTPAWAPHRDARR